MKEIQTDSSLHLQLIVTGMHLSPEFGLTHKVIGDDGFAADKQVEILLSSDTEVGISKAMGLAMISMSEAYQELSPDLIVVLGDRYEIFASVAAAMIAQIPVAHLHGGEATEGLIDEAIRHSITKMAHLHFAATEVYRKRIIQLGEDPNRVFNTGTPGLDNIDKLNLLNRADFERAIGFELGSRSILVTFHPVTLEKNTSEIQFMELLAALDELPEAHVIFTKPNADTYGRVIIDLIDNYVKENPHRSAAYQSLGQLKYLSALSHVNVVLGNSSSALIEAPSFGIPTINVGDRQRGRMKASSVIDAEPTRPSIIGALQKAFSSEFREEASQAENPYGKPGASWKIKEILKNYQLEGLLKKKFHNINFQ